MEIKITDRIKKEPKREVNISRLAMVTGYSVSHISRVFRGETAASVVCLETLAKALGYDLTKLRERIKEGGIHATKNS